MPAAPPGRRTPPVVFPVHVTTADRAVDVHQQPTCFACGADNPSGLHGRFVSRGEEVLGTLVVTDAMVGAPGRLHGGVMMAFIDEALGLVCMNLGVETMTASLTVDLRAPAYVGATLTQRGWVERREGRKWFMRSEVHEGDRLLAEARGLWIQPRAG
jgi:acyl-coenzyme A thioesterase PaaI-like protein